MIYKILFFCTMRPPVFINLAALSGVALARPCRTKALPEDNAVTQSTSMPSTWTYETTSTVRDTTRVTESDPTELGNGFYYVLEAQFKGRQLRTERSNRVRRQEHDAFYRFDDKMIQATPTFMDEATNSQTSPPKSSTDFTEPTPTPHNLIPHWNYQKHSVAAACIFVIVIIVAFAVLMALYFKKVKMFFQRRSRERRSYLAPKYNAIGTNSDAMTSNAHLNKESKPTRGTFSFDFGISRPPSPGFVVEEDPKLGSVTRVYRASRADISDDLDPAPSPPHVSFEGGKLVCLPKAPGNAGKLCDSVQKPVIVAPPPLLHVASMSAKTEEMPPSPEALSQAGDDYDYEGTTLGGSGKGKSDTPDTPSLHDEYMRPLTRVASISDTTGNPPQNEVHSQEYELLLQADGFLPPLAHVATMSSIIEEVSQSPEIASQADGFLPPLAHVGTMSPIIGEVPYSPEIVSQDEDLPPPACAPLVLSTVEEAPQGPSSPVNASNNNVDSINDLHDDHNWPTDLVGLNKPPGKGGLRGADTAIPGSVWGIRDWARSLSDDDTGLTNGQGGSQGSSQGGRSAGGSQSGGGGWTPESSW